MLPRPADGQVLAAQRPDAGLRRGRQGRRPPHPAPATATCDAQEAGKISKSKGSSPFRELLEQFSAETIRFFLLSTHYRRPIDYSTQRIREVETGLETFYRFFQRYQRVTGESFHAIAPAARRSEGDFDPAGDPLLADVAERRSDSWRRWTTISTPAGPSATCSSWSAA